MSTKNFWTRMFAGCLLLFASETTLIAQTSYQPGQGVQSNNAPYYYNTQSNETASVGFPTLRNGEIFQEPSAAQGAIQQAMQDPNMSSAPSPTQVTPETPAASNDQNFFGGHSPYQDLSSLMPGRFNNTKYKWYGFVRLDGIYDFDPIASTDDFVVSSIPVPQGEGQNSVLTPRYSRLGWDTETPWEACDWTIKTRIEVDFFNGNTSGAFGSFPLRLRFAWVDFGPYLVGQANSLFMDADVFPNVLDYEGPPGMVLVRQPIIAYRIPIGCYSKLSLGIEQAYSDIQWFEGGNWIVNPGTGIVSTAGVSRNIQDLPDFTANYRYNGDYGHMQIAGIARKISFQPAAGSAVDDLGFGVNFTGSWNPWSQLMGCCPDDENKPLMAKSRFLYQYATGDGISRYIQDINGLGLDATFDPVNGFNLLNATGWFVSYEQWWSQKVASVFSVGDSDPELTDTLPDNTYDFGDYASANIIYFPVERMGVGLEYLVGSRENKDGESGTANRIQMALQYKF